MNTIKKITLDTLNGLSTGIVEALIQEALINQLVQALLPSMPQLSFILALTAFASALLPAISAVCVGMTAKLTPIQTSSLALAATAGAGNFVMNKGKIAVIGSGDVINTAITIMIAYGLVLFFGKKLKAYTILLVPLLVLLINRITTNCNGYSHGNGIRLTYCFPYFFCWYRYSNQHFWNCFRFS